MNLHGLQSNDLPQGPWFLQGPFASKTMIPKNLDPFHWGNMGPFPLRTVSCFRKNLGPSWNIAFHDHEISAVKSIELKTYHFKSKCLATMSHHFAYIRVILNPITIFLGPKKNWNFISCSASLWSQCIANYEKCTIIKICIFILMVNFTYKNLPWQYIIWLLGWVF